jgi:hypothetical protein
VAAIAIRHGTPGAKFRRKAYQRCSQWSAFSQPGADMPWRGCHSSPALSAHPKPYTRLPPPPGLPLLFLNFQRRQCSQRHQYYDCDILRPLAVLSASSSPRAALLQAHPLSSSQPWPPASGSRRNVASGCFQRTSWRESATNRRPTNRPSTRPFLSPNGGT